MDEEDHWISETRHKTRKTPSTCCIIATVLGIILAASLATIIGLGAVLGQARYHASTSGSSPTTPSPTTPSPTSTTPTPTPQPVSNETCSTPGCVELSSLILSKLDASVNPCDDFYAFACNRFINDSIIPYGAPAVRSFETPLLINTERLRSLMESGNNRSVEAIAKAITYYQSCMKMDTSENLISSLKGLIRSTGGWPLVGVDLGTTWDINDRQGLLLEKLYGNPAFFSLGVSIDLTNTSRNILTVSQSGLSSPTPDYYKPGPLREQLKSSIIGVLSQINSSISNDTYGDAADDILDFETEMSKFYDFDLKGRNVSSKVTYMTFAELREAMPVFNWSQNVEYYGSLAGITDIDLSPHVNVLPLQYISSINDLIQRTNSTVLENYAKWQFISSFLPYLSPEFTASSPSPVHYKICVSKVQEDLPLALSRTYTEQYLPMGAREKLTVLTEELEKALHSRISGRDWLDAATKDRALKKLSNIKRFLAYPDFIYNDTFLNGYYSGLNVSLDHPFFINVINSKRSSFIKKFSYFAMANNRNVWALNAGVSNPTETNAQYNPKFNQMYILEGILDTPVFKTYWPEYFLFGTMGYVVGHEYTHGFDNNGRQFNEVGDFENWWTPQSLNNFNSRAQCFIEQYGNYFLPAGPVNGTLTLGENIADNGGLATAYQAYKSYVNMTGKVQQKLPGLSYNPDQLFFIGHAQIYCWVATLATQKNRLLTDPHSPDPIRPLGILSNSREFAEAFSCPTGSRMNPMKKCELW